MERAASAAPVVTAALAMNCRLDVFFMVWSPLDCAAAVRLRPAPFRCRCGRGCTKSRKRLHFAYTARQSSLSSGRLMLRFSARSLHKISEHENRIVPPKTGLLLGRRGGARRLLAWNEKLVTVRRCFLLLRLRAQFAEAFYQSRNFLFGIIYFSQRQQQMVHGDLVVRIFAQYHATLFDGALILSGLQIKIAEHVARQREVRLELYR